MPFTVTRVADLRTTSNAGQIVLPTVWIINPGQVGIEPGHCVNPAHAAILRAARTQQRKACRSPWPALLPTGAVPSMKLAALPASNRAQHVADLNVPLTANALATDQDGSKR